MSMPRWLTGLMALLLAMLGFPIPSTAQDLPLSEILVKLIQSDVRLAAADPSSGFPSHDAHFIPGEEQRLAPFLFNQSILSQLSTFPLGSSSGGFSYSLDPALGTFVRSTDSFGPTFAERALTIGRNRLNLGMSYQHVTYSSFEGEDLDDGSIKFYLTHQQTPEHPFFEGDLIEAALSLKLSTDTLAMFANYGVTDRLDVGFAVPVVSVQMDATIDATVLRLATGTRPIHVFPSGSLTSSFRQSGDALGVGDILLRAKYQLSKSPGGGLAGALDLRLPSGDDRDLLGVGATQAKVSVIASSTYGKVSPHFNVGYTFSEATSASSSFDVSDEVNYAAGVEVVAGHRLTVLADVIGRTLRKAGRLGLREKTFEFITGAPTDPATVRGAAEFTEFARGAGNLNSSLAAVGAKFNPFGNMLISASVLIPLTEAGIRARPTPVIGFDYAF